MSVTKIVLLLVSFVVVASIFVAAAVFISGRSVPTAEVRFLVRAQVPTLFAEEKPISSQERDGYRATQIAMFRSPSVLIQAMNSPAVRCNEVLPGEEDKIKWLQEHIEVEFEGDSEILVLRIASRGVEPKHLTLLADAVANAFMKIVADVEERTKRLQIDILLRTHTKLLAEQASLRRELAGLGDVSPEVLDEWRVTEYTNLSRRRHDWLQKRQELEFERALLKSNAEASNSAEESADSVTDNGQDDSRDGARLIAQSKAITAIIEQLDAERQQLLAGAVAGHEHDPVELEARTLEIQVKEEILKELQVKIERLDIEFIGRDRRITLLEAAFLINTGDGWFSKN